jgi:hypothetical protein
MMAVYLFTYHAYRSWDADNPRGYVRKGQGILAPDAAVALQYNRSAIEPPVLFSAEHQQVLLWILVDACRRREWRMHRVAGEPSHVRVLVSWRDFLSWQKVRDKLKNLMSLELGRQFSAQGRRWFSKGASRKRVRDRRHFEYLMNIYLPRHGGLVWKEGESLPWCPSASADG